MWQYTMAYGQNVPSCDPLKQNRERGEHSKQMCSGYSGVATGVQGGRVPPLTGKKMPKIGKKRGKIGKKEEKRQKSGTFFHFASRDR